MEYLKVIAGLVALVYAGDILVRGSVSLAKNMGVSNLVIGLTVVAFGTSAPELVVGVDAALSGFSDMALGNVVGSNIANILLVIGIPAMIYPFNIHDIEIRHNMIIMLVATGFFILLVFYKDLTAPSGMLLLIMLFAYLLHAHKRSKKQTASGIAMGEEMDELCEDAQKTSTALFYLVGGLMGLMLGAHILVEGAVIIAQNFGVSEAVIGLTIIAIGTSLPELITALMAARRGHGDLAVGNVIGSNVFNLYAVMGAVSIAAPIHIPVSFLKVDLWIMAAAALILLPFTLKKITISRRTGFLFILFYVTYLIYLGISNA